MLLNHLRLASVFILALFGAVGNAAQADLYAEASVIIRSATVIDINTGEKKLADIFINGQQISAVQAHSESAVEKSTIEKSASLKNTVVIDGTGKYAIPGLWDTHVHLTFVKELEDRLPALFIANGVTSVRDMAARMEDIQALRKRIDQTGAATPTIWMAGPMMDGVPPVFDGSPETHHPPIGMGVGTPQEAIEQVDKLVAQGVKVIKTYNLLRPKVFGALVKRAHYHGLPVAGHIPLRMTTLEALQMGIDGIEHLNSMNVDCTSDPKAMQAERVAILDASSDQEKGFTLSRKASQALRPEVFADQDEARCDELIQAFVEHGTWHSPTISASAFRGFRFYQRPDWFDSYRYLPASVQTEWREKAALWSDPRQYPTLDNKAAWVIKAIGKMHKAGVRMMTGTDTPSTPFAPPGFSVHNELSALVISGLSPLSALQAATINPARFFSVENKQGTIEAGKVADLILLNADPLADIENTRTINTVISRGQVYSRQKLDEMLTSLAEE